MGDMGQKTDTKCKITHFLMGLVHDYKRLTLFIKLKAAHAYAYAHVASSCIGAWGSGGFVCG